MAVSQNPQERKNRPEGTESLEEGRERKIVNDAITKFWSRIKKTDSCWPWIGGTNDRGYGVVCIGNDKVYAHRFSFVLNIGRIPEFICACHSCDNPPCCNPDHLFLGTHLDNMTDAETKGRFKHSEEHIRKITVAIPRGDHHSCSKVTGEMVRDIRNRFSDRLTPLAYISREYGLSAMSVSDILRGKTWKHLL